MFFCAAKRAQYKEANPNVTPAQLMKLLAEAWNATSETEKVTKPISNLLTYFHFICFNVAD